MWIMAMGLGSAGNSHQRNVYQKLLSNSVVVKYGKVKTRALTCSALKSRTHNSIEST
jgi:hypothetical protein